MSDLRTELLTKVIPSLDALSFDDEGDDKPSVVEVVESVQATPPAAQMSQVRSVFEFFRQTGTQAHTARECAESFGGDRDSMKNSASMIAQLVDRGFLVRAGSNERGVNLYTWSGKEWKVMNKTEVMRHANLIRKQKFLERKEKEKGKAAKVKVKLAAPAPAKTPITSRVNIDNLTISEARSLYDELKKIFGG